MTGAPPYCVTHHYACERRARDLARQLDKARVENAELRADVAHKEAECESLAKQLCDAEEALEDGYDR